MNRPGTALLLAAAIAAAPAPGLSQAVPSVPAQRAVAVLAGVSQYDLSGTGTTPFGAVRFDLPVARAIIVEPGLTLLPYEPQFGERVTHILPEVQLQVQRAASVFRPYLGAGLGASWAVRSGEDEVDFTLAGSGGVRLVTQSAWVLRAELRVRVIDPWVGTTADWSIGFGRAF